MRNKRITVGELNTDETITGKIVIPRSEVPFKIGDEVWVHGYVDEIRNHAVIIRNGGGYFGTDITEITTGTDNKGEWEWLSSTGDRFPCEKEYRCSVCKHKEITHDDRPWQRFCPCCGADMRRD